MKDPLSKLKHISFRDGNNGFKDKFPCCHTLTLDKPGSKLTTVEVEWGYQRCSLFPIPPICDSTRIVGQDRLCLYLASVTTVSVPRHIPPVSVPVTSLEEHCPLLQAITFQKLHEGAIFDGRTERRAS